MNYKDIRRFSLKVFLGFLGLTALIAIISVLTGDLGPTEAKILATTLTVSAASICAMCCAAFIERRGFSRLGIAGIALCILAAALVVGGLWSEIDDETYWKATVTVAILAIACAHAFLLVLPHLGLSGRWLQPSTTVSIGVLALQIITALWAEIDAEWYWRGLIVVAIVVGLETLAVPIVMKLADRRVDAGGRLVLTAVSDGIYRDTTGRRYRVSENSAG